MDLQTLASCSPTCSRSVKKKCNKNLKWRPSAFKVKVGRPSAFSVCILLFWVFLPLRLIVSQYVQTKVGKTPVTVAITGRFLVQHLLCNQYCPAIASNLQEPLPISQGIHTFPCHWWLYNIQYDQVIKKKKKRLDNETSLYRRKETKWSGTFSVIYPQWLG